MIAFIMIFVVVDMMENLDDFIDQNVTYTIVLKYYLVFIPEIVRLLLPVAMLFGCLFTTGKLSNLNEITAMKSSGISLYRFMVPILILSVFICWGAVYFGGYLVPLANRSKTFIDTEYLKKNINFFGSNLFFQDAKYRVVSLNYFNEAINQGVGVSIQNFDSTDITKVRSRIDAKKMEYDSLNRVWVAYDAVSREFGEISETVTKYPELRLTGLNCRPNDILIRQQKPEVMNLDELRTAIKNQKKSGIDPTAFTIEYYSRYSFAMTGVIVVLFGLPFSTNKRRGSLAVQVGINGLITFIYLVLLKVVQAFGINGSLDPLMTSWMVNFIFLVAAFFNIIRMRQ
jgi:lipopolysaccharide export system permease protein